MHEITMSVRNDIKETLKDAMTTKKEERKIALTPNSQPESITQNISQQTPRNEELNNLADEMDIEKTPNKRKTPTPSEENQNQEDQEAIEETNSESASKTRAGTNKTTKYPTERAKMSK